MLVLAFDTATDVATSALLRDGDVLGERISVPRTLLEDLDALLRDVDAQPAEVDALVVGTGPGSFTSTRIGLAVARGLGLALDIPAAGVSTLDALAAGRADAFPVIDARRREVFVLGPRVLEPDDLALEPGTLCVGSGAVRYRAYARTHGRARASRRRRAARSSRPTSRVAGSGVRVRPTRSSRSTSVHRTPRSRGRSHERRASPPRAA